MTDEPPPELTTKIVAAYVRRNQVAPDQLATLISTVHQALIGRGKPAEATSSARTPAVSIRRSVQHDSVTCLECGWTGSMLRRHLTMRHRLTPDEYRARWSLAREHALVAPAYRERRSTLAKQSGLGRGGRRAAGKATGGAASAVSTTTQPRRRPRSTATPA
jgi:predicted transcriptional regulator